MDITTDLVKPLPITGLSANSVHPQCWKEHSSKSRRRDLRPCQCGQLLWRWAYFLLYCWAYRAALSLYPGPAPPGPERDWTARRRGHEGRLKL